MNGLCNLLSTDGFPARWACGQWSALHGWVHITSDVAIFGAYAAIPATLGYYLRKRRDIPFSPVIVLFMLFILSCGIGHLIEATIFWRPWYRLSAAVKVVTALVSWATVLALIRVVPRALDLPGLERANQALQDEVAERRLAEERVRTVVEAAPNAMVMVDAGGAMVMVNSQAERLFGYSREELLGRPVEMLLPERDRARHPEHREMFRRAPSIRPMGAGRNLTGRRKDGSEVPIEIGLNPVRTEDGVFALAAIIDVSDRLRDEAQLQAAVAQSDVLLREVHHRVKNNMQVVSSLLRLHAMKLHDPAQRAVFDSCRDRIQAMALIHERLYGPDHFARVSLGAYLEEMTGMILRSNVGPEMRVDLRLQLDAVELDLDTAMPLSLIASELVLNAVRHAFVGRGSGTLTVSLKAGGDTHTLTVQDDGPGLPAGEAPAKAGGIGFALVDALVRQIGGERVLEPCAVGVCVGVRWPARRVAGREGKGANDEAHPDRRG